MRGSWGRGWAWGFPGRCLGWDGATELIHGPPNAGKRGVDPARFPGRARPRSVLVVPNADDVFSFERELCGDGAALGGAAMTFGALFRTVATAAGSPPGAELPPRSGCGVVAPDRDAAAAARAAAALSRTARLRRRLRAPAGRAASGRGRAGGGRGRRRALEGSAYLGDVATVYSAYATARERLGRVDSHGIARAAIAALRADPSFWGDRPVFLYGLDDLTRTS